MKSIPMENGFFKHVLYLILYIAAAIMCEACFNLKRLDISASWYICGVRLAFRPRSDYFTKHNYNTLMSLMEIRILMRLRTDI